MQVLHASHNTQLYSVSLPGAAAIADLVRDSMIDTLNAGEFDFWLASSIRPGHRTVNRTATEMFLNLTGFSAATVPLLCGNVVITTHGCDGQAAGLTRGQIVYLVGKREVAWRADRILSRRCARVERHRRIFAEREQQVAMQSLMDRLGTIRKPADG